MNNYDDSLKNYENAMNSAGTASQKFAIYQDSVQAKLDEVTASWEGFWQNSINSSVIKTVLELLSQLIDGFDNVGRIILITSGIFIAFKSKAIIDFIVGIAATIKGLFTFTAAANGAAVAASTFQKALGIFGLITTAITLLVVAIDTLSNKQENLNKQIQENINKYQQQKSAIDQLISSYKQNAELAKTDEDAKNTLYDIQAELVTIFGESAKAIDLESGAIDDNIVKIKELNKVKLQEFLDANKIIADENKRILAEQKFGTASFDVGTYGASVGKFITNGDNLTLKEYIDSLKKLRNELSTGALPDYTIDSIKGVQNLNTEIDKQEKKYNELNGIIVQVDTAQKQLTGSTENTGDVVEDAGNKIQKYTQDLDELNKVTDSAQSTFKDLSSMYEQVNEGQELNNDQMLDLIQNYPVVLNYMDSEGNLLVSQTDLLKILFEAKKADLKLTLQTEKDKADAVIRSLEVQRDAYLGFYSAIGATLGYSEEQAATMFGFDKESYDKAVVAAKDAQAKINALDKLTFKDYSGKKTSSSGKEIDANLSLIEKDRYSQLEASLNKTDVLLEKNKALQALHEDDISLMKEEQQLLKQKQDQLHLINEERRKERDELQKSMSSQGFSFSGTGDSTSVANYTNVINKLTDDVNKHRTDKDKTYYNTLKQRLEDAQNNFKRFNELQINEIPKASIEWWNLQKAIGDVDAQILETTENLAEERLQNLADVEKQLVEIIKQGVQDKIDVLEKEHDKEMELLEERHDARIESYEDDLDEFEDYTNEKLGLLEDQYDEEDFLKELSKKRKEANEIQQKINELSLDDSLEARTKVAELVEELADKETEITKFKTDRERTLRKDGLSDQLSDYQKYIQELKDKENDRYETKKDILEDEYEEDKTRLNKQLENESLYAEARKLLMNSTLEEIAEKFDLFSDKFGEGLSVLGDKIQNEFIEKLKDALALIEEMGGFDIETGTSGSSSIIDKMKQNSAAWFDASASEKERLANENLELGTSLGWVRKDDGHWYKPDGTRAYASGTLSAKAGLAKVNEQGTELRVLNSGDGIVNAGLTKNLIDFAKIAPDFLNNFKFLTPKLPNISGGNGMTIDASITVVGSVDKSFMSQLEKSQNNQLDKIIKSVSRTTVGRGSF